MAESQKMLARVSPCHREMVEVQKMLASLSPCLRQMAVLQKMLASVSPFPPEVRTGPKCLLEELIKSRWTRLRSLLSRLQLRTMHSQMLQLFLKSEFPTVCPTGILEVTAMKPSSENSGIPGAVISSSSPVLCQPHHLDSESIPDETLLFHTLVRDGVLQLAFQDEFEKLVRAAQTSANRHRRQRAYHGNLEALELHERKSKRARTSPEKST